jgi:glycosyltransferase involved in cell wall biosynthesis
MKPWHGLPLLIEAFERVHRVTPDSRLLIVGDGKAMTELQATLRGRGMADRIHFTGAVGSDQIPGLVTSMDVAVAPYPPLSNFYFSPLKIYEYMAAARPVVASRIGSLTELIEHEMNGLLCPPGDIDALAASILRLKNDPTLRHRLGAAARKTVLANHTWDEVARRTLSLISWSRQRVHMRMEAAS